jgi:signal transduction histidine kinase
VTQEALTNTARHANASRVRIELRRSKGLLSLSINDNGEGFNHPKAMHGLGLIGLKERVTELSGTVRIDSSPGNGTRIVAAIPVHATPA